MIALAPSDGPRVCEKLDDLYFVYQPASAETHVFNEVTFLILECLANGPRSFEDIKVRTEELLGVRVGEIGAGDFSFAMGRLEELGIIEYLSDDQLPQ